MILTNLNTHKRDLKIKRERHFKASPDCVLIHIQMQNFIIFSDYMLLGFLLINFHLNLNLIYPTRTLKRNNLQALQGIHYFVPPSYYKKTSLIKLQVFQNLSQLTLILHITLPTSLIIKGCLKSQRPEHI